ncbi:hypothetical protein Lal_00041685 [Lupinus albus]|nr:hypothetical protein Lal_00041685 [Lupinus albus]
MDLNDVEVLKRSNLWQARSMQHNLLWLKEDDSNSKYFHGIVNSRRRNNTIQGFQIHENWIDDVKGVKQGVHNHFQTLLSKRNKNRPTLRGVPFNKLFHSDNANLTASFDEFSTHSFSCLGILVGVNHKRQHAWNSFFYIIKSRISSWKRSQISFGGRVILINVVLFVLPLYYVSFYKAPLSYYVRSAYKLLSHHDQQQSTIKQHSHFLWKSKSPLKRDFVRSWRELLCSLCNEYPESTHHLFSSCTLTYSIWQLIYKLMDISVALPINLFHHSINHMGMVKDRNSWKLWSVIWLATTWAIWFSRNDLIFNSIKSSLQQIFK